MALRHSTPIKWAPRSVCDALDSTDVPTGAMASLKNLIVDPSTQNLFQCRPASVRLTSFNGFASPGFISVYYILGSTVFGLISTARNAGRDEPFAFDLTTNSFITVGGTITATTTPASPSDIGVWVPPTMDLIGTNIIVTHPGFNGVANVYFGWFDVSDPSNPTWNAGNLTGLITFTTPPSFVKNFNGRAYYLVNPPTGQPSAVFSDVLLPRNVTNANQALTFGDNLPLTALGTLNLQNQLGGIIQALIVFKGVTNTYQITGDAALSNLTVNALNITTGTLAPRSVCNTPKGLAFVSPEGLRIIDQQAKISDPVGAAGYGITVPFIYALVPSRICANCGGNVLRISTQNSHATGSPYEEYWFDFSRSMWTGPHTFPASMIVPYSNTFIEAAIGVNAKLFQSDVVQSATPSFTENGTAMTWRYRTALMPDTDQMCENAMVETTIYMSLVADEPVYAQALDEELGVFDTVTVQGEGSFSLWGDFVWGVDLWGGSFSALYPRRLAWHEPIVFRRMQLNVAGNSVADFKIGRTHLRYEMLGYLQQEPDMGLSALQTEIGEIIFTETLQPITVEVV